MFLLSSTPHSLQVFHTLRCPPVIVEIGDAVTICEGSSSCVERDSNGTLLSFVVGEPEAAQVNRKVGHPEAAKTKFGNAVHK